MRFTNAYDFCFSHFYALVSDRLLLRLCAKRVSICPRLPLLGGGMLKRNFAIAVDFFI